MELSGNEQVLQQLCSQQDGEIRRLKKALKAGESRIKMLMQALPAGLALVNADGQIVVSNKRFCELFRAEASQLAGRKFHTLFLEDSQHSIEPLKEAMMKMESLRPLEAEARPLESAMFPAEILLTDFSNDDQRLLLAHISDISERREIQRLRQQFVSMIVHDIRTPVTSLNFLVENVLDQFDDLPPKVVSNLQGALRVVSSLTDLLDELLDYQRIQAGKLELHLAPASISHVIDQSLEAVAGLANNKSIQLEKESTDEELIIDVDRIRRVIINLLSNAIKFSPKGSGIRVESVLGPGDWELRVIDQGRGIPADHKDAIFEMYRQLKATDSQGRLGFGIGLPICKLIVEAHRGQIGVHSEVDKGSTFWFRLPISELDSQVQF